MFAWEFFTGGIIALYYFWRAAQEDFKTGLISQDKIMHLAGLGAVGWLVWIQQAALTLDFALLVEPARSVVVCFAILALFLLVFKEQLGKGDIYLLGAGQIAFPVFVFNMPFALASLFVGLVWAAREKEKFKAAPFIFLGSLVAFLTWAIT